MIPDFSLLLVILTLFSGLVWLIDNLFFRRRRMDCAVQQKIQRARDPVLIEYSRSLFPVLLIVLLFRSFLFEPFKIPSGSMIPTLLIGDFILVNKYAYGLKLPVLNTKIISVSEPQHGEVVVFRFPADPGVNFIKRMIGLPGDTITYRDKQLFINGEALATDERGVYSSGEVKCSTPASDARRYSESLGLVQHDILLHLGSAGRDGQWIVPEGHYFVMGDNRDRSNDSREWGFVPEQNLMGRAVGIWMNFDLNKGCGDLSRIGDGIH
ncbi:MAG TPA: signal peptidase I [Xanthomonadales bacterium]|nr:signal peptidase I [Xanthomonadales bacterium]